MLPPRVDADEKTDDAVQRIAAALGRRAGVRRGAAVDDALTDDPEARTAHAPAPLRRGMRRERECDSVEHARAEQIDLSPAVLLRRSSDELDRHSEILLPRDLQERADIRHGDEVVTAAVTHTRERVVLREERDRGSGRADTSTKRGLEATDTHLHRHTMTFDQRGDPSGRATFLIGKLGIGMDLAGELHQLVGERGGERLHDAVYCPTATFALLDYDGRGGTSDAPPGPHRT